MVVSLHCFKMKLVFILLTLIIVDVSGGHFENETLRICKGKTFKNVTLTAYYPFYDDEDFSKGYQDVHGKKLRTLQDYLDDRTDFVTLAMDQSLRIPYGTVVCIPELNSHYGHKIRLEVRDNGSDLYGMGYHRADVCVRSEIDSYDAIVNRKVTLVFEKEP